MPKSKPGVFTADEQLHVRTDPGVCLKATCERGFCFTSVGQSSDVRNADRRLWTTVDAGREPEATERTDFRRTAHAAQSATR